jgi:hypothetical protein
MEELPGGAKVFGGGVSSPITGCPCICSGNLWSAADSMGVQSGGCGCYCACSIAENEFNNHANGDKALAVAIQ